LSVWDIMLGALDFTPLNRLQTLSVATCGTIGFNIHIVFEFFSESAPTLPSSLRQLDVRIPWDSYESKDLIQTLERILPYTTSLPAGCRLDFLVELKEDGKFKWVNAMDLIGRGINQ
jgi:hypothetical protein